VKIRNYTFLFALLFPIFICRFVEGNEEDYMRWRTVKVDCFETSETGKVGIVAEVGDKGIASLHVTAFGQSFVLTPSDLKKINPFPLDSLKVTHAAGYVELGGDAVCFKFQRAYYDKEQKLHEEEAVVSISKGKGLEVTICEKKQGG
jgi:hypothetical protein